MSLIVHKYGGTSVETIDRIKNVAAHLRDVTRAGHKILCVVSAMGQQTNELLSMALQISADPPKRELDMLLTVGERLSMSLVSIALHELGLRSLSLTGSQSGILTDQTHTNARISKITGERIRDALVKNDVVIIAGFQGVNPDTKEITTLGRGGSDLTAVALAHALKAESCEIYTDVQGICTADPRIVPQARLLNTITWDAASELAWNGAKVIQSRSVHLASKFNIPLRKRSSFDLSNSGTLISGRAKMESVAINAITNKDHQCMVEISGNVHRKTAQEVILWLWQQGCAPLINNQTLKEDTTLRLQLLIPEGLLDRLSAMVEKMEDVVLFPVLRELASIAVVGEGFFQSPETVGQILDACPNPIVFAETRNNCITICTKSIDQDATVKALHARFFEGKV